MISAQTYYDILGLKHWDNPKYLNSNNKMKINSIIALSSETKFRKLTETRIN